jgi:hypothetical protein
VATNAQARAKAAIKDDSMCLARTNPRSSWFVDTGKNDLFFHFQISKSEFKIFTVLSMSVQCCSHPYVMLKSLLSVRTVRRKSSSVDSMCYTIARLVAIEALQNLRVLTTIYPFSFRNHANTGVSTASAPGHVE